MNAEELISFESSIKDLWESGQLPSLVHLCGGNEKELVEIFSEIKTGDWIFSTHRTHFHALLAGIEPGKLLDRIYHGDSMFVYSKEHNFLCSAVLAGCAGIAAGVAWAIKEDPIWKTLASWRLPHVWCFIGDGGIEEGHFWEAINLVEGWSLPCTFIVEDNDRSVDTDKAGRRGPIEAIEKALATYKCVRVYHYTPTYPHAGSGCNFKIEFAKEAAERLLRR